MLKWLKPDPIKKLQKESDKKAEQALQAQRNGNIALYADLTKEVEDIDAKVKKLKADQS